jgi:flagellar L-ring protein precursor FlgH
VALGLSACATTPTSIVQMPLTARPLTSAQMQAAPNSGAIYQPAAYRPIFEDRRARHIGDADPGHHGKTSAVKAGASSGNKSGSVSASVPGPLQSTFGGTIGANSASNPMPTTSRPAIPSRAPWA